MTQFNMQISAQIDNHNYTKKKMLQLIKTTFWKMGLKFQHFMQDSILEQAKVVE